MRIALLTMYFWPEIGAPQTRLLELARGLQVRGHRVMVVTGPPHYPSGNVHHRYPVLRPFRETHDGVGIVRLPMIPRPNAGLIDRVVDGGSFSASLIAAVPLVRASDAFVVESPPLFLGGSAALLRHMTRRPYIFHVADPWPDFPIELGAIRGRIPIALARGLESVAYRSASMVTTVTPPLVDRLSGNPAAHGKVRLLLNAVDVDRFDPGIEPRSCRHALGWSHRTTITYVGTVGLAQGLGTLVDAVALLPPDVDVQIRVVGTGAEAAELAKRSSALNLGRLSFDGDVPAAQIPNVLAASDAVLCLLKAGPVHGEALPTKLLEGLAAGRPMIVSADGYASRLVADHDAGFVAPAGDERALASAIEQFWRSDRRVEIGAAARTLALSFRREEAVRTMEGYLREVTS